MSSNRRHEKEFLAACELARRRVNAVLACINVLLPGAAMPAAFANLPALRPGK